MTTPAGGYRDRLIRTSLYELVRQTLEDLGWMDTGRAHRPINVVASPVPVEDEIPFNTVAVFIDIVNDEPTEIGSNATDDSHFCTVDIFAESEAIGVELMGDVRASLQGKLPAIGRTAPRLFVYEWPAATPGLLFTCEIEDMRRDRANNWPQPWLEFWFSLSFTIVDEGVR